MKRGSAPSLAARLARHLPETIAINPERTLIYLGCALIGLSALSDASGRGALRHLWPFAQTEWGVAMLVGGAAGLWGLFKHNRSPERLGQLLLLFGSAFFAVILVVEFGLPGLITALIFLFIALAMVIRLIVGAAAREQNIQVSEEMRQAQQAEHSGGES